MSCKEYRIYNCNRKNPGGPLYTLATVAFQTGGRTYDYICDIPDVQPGDRVIVKGYDGETEVEVLAVFQRHESELGLPAERYSRILRKA